APRTPEASKQLEQVARAKVIMRIPPGQDPGEAMEALAKHLESNAPWGAEVTITREGVGSPFSLTTGGPGYGAMQRAMSEAFGKDVVQMGAGGSIPFVAEFADVFPEATLMLTGAGDPKCNAHSEDESVDLADLEKS